MAHLGVCSTHIPWVCKGALDEQQGNGDFDDVDNADVVGILAVFVFNCGYT